MKAVIEGNKDNLGQNIAISGSGDVIGYSFLRTSGILRWNGESHRHIA